MKKNYRENAGFLVSLTAISQSPVRTASSPIGSPSCGAVAVMPHRLYISHHMPSHRYTSAPPPQRDRHSQRKRDARVWGLVRRLGLTKVVHNLIGDAHVRGLSGERAAVTVRALVCAGEPVSSCTERGKGSGKLCPGRLLISIFLLFGSVDVFGCVMCSGGEKRRVSIAVELLTRPGLLLLDEPTTGLDSTNAARVVEVLGGLAAGGVNVLLSIHQPRPDVLRAMDRLLLLSGDGRVSSRLCLSLCLPRLPAPSTSTSLHAIARPYIPVSTLHRCFRGA